MRQRYFIANLKMNLSSPEEAERYFAVLSREAQGKRWSRTGVVVAPPFVHLSRFAKNLPNGVQLGAQNVFPEKDGAYTGEISAAMLVGEGARYVIIGHSERRMYAGETDEMIAAKVKASLRAGLVPILCVGETGEERKIGKTADVLEKQVGAAFSDIAPMDAEKIIIAYEPRWAIGTDQTPTSEEILQARIFLIKTIGGMYGMLVAERVAILYGGSVKAALLDLVCFRAQMDGVLVGRESLFPYEVVKMADMIESYEPPVHRSE